MRCDRCSAGLLPVVAIDIDGTLAQWHAHFMEFLEQWLPTKFYDYSWDGLGEFSDKLGTDKHTYRQAKLAFRSGGFKRWMEPVWGSRTFMQQLSTLPVEVWVTTTRPWMRHDNVDPDTVEWLKRNEMPYKRLMYDDDKYLTLTELVDPQRVVLVLDDEAEQFDRCSDLGLPFVLKKHAFNTGITAPVETADYRDVIAMVKERIGFNEALRQ
jgi:hypothetical protein